MLKNNIKDLENKFFEIKARSNEYFEKIYKLKKKKYK